MGDFLIFWFEHYRRPLLSAREQIILCAKTRHAGYVIDVSANNRRFRKR